MGGLDAATRLLSEALARREAIVVVGDFDADGATGTAVAVRGLRLLGAAADSVRFKVPQRAVHGYGLSPALVAELRADATELLFLPSPRFADEDAITAAASAPRLSFDDFVAHLLAGDEPL